MEDELRVRRLAAAITFRVFDCFFRGKSEINNDEYVMARMTSENTINIYSDFTGSRPRAGEEWTFPIFESVSEITSLHRTFDLIFKFNFFAFFDAVSTMV